MSTLTATSICRILESAPPGLEAGAIVLGALGWLDTGRGDFSEQRLFERAYDLARHVDDEVGTAHTATNLAELRLAMGHSDDAHEALDIALTAHQAVWLYEGLSYGLEAAARLAWSDRRSEDAARLLGATDGYATTWTCASGVHG